jgi:hypothetical protein
VKRAGSVIPRKASRHAYSWADARITPSTSKMTAARVRGEANTAGMRELLSARSGQRDMSASPARSTRPDGSGARNARDSSHNWSTGACRRWRQQGWIGRPGATPRAHPQRPAAKPSEAGQSGEGGSPVIARSEAPRQSPSLCKWDGDCFALLAITGKPEAADYPHAFTRLPRVARRCRAARLAAEFPI